MQSKNQAACNVNAYTAPIRTCDADLELVTASFAGIDKVHDAGQDLGVKPPSQPALHEPPMHQWAGSAEGMTPLRGMDYPPRLQSHA